MPRKHARALRALLWTSTVLLILWLALIKLPMLITRIRFAHLLADFHTLQPDQSNWQDAQRLMTRWGKWGHYDGACTPTDCVYSILIPAPYTGWSYVPQIAAALGWRFTFLNVQLDVQDGKIVRTSTRLVLGDFMIDSHVHSRLTDVGPDVLDAANDDWSPGEDAQLGDHPDYKIGQGHCEGCLEGVFSYTASLSHDEVLRHTKLDLSCLTRLRSCTEITDVWLIGQEWETNADLGGDYNVPPKLPPTSCRVNPRARGRDATLILEVEPLSVDMEPDPRAMGAREPIEVAHVRLLRILKGSIIPAPGQTLAIAPFAGYTHFDPPWSPEHLAPSRPSLIAVDGDNFDGGDFFLERCGVFDDTPAIVAGVQAGIVQDIKYRHPPAYFGWP